MTATTVNAYGGGVMLRDARGRFAGVQRGGVPVPSGGGFRVIGGRVFTVTVLPPARPPAWACKVRPVGKSQHGKRGGVRHGERERWEHRAARMATA
ncbi:hypothetical protein UFOVP929_41 [uncultured Caudovirales phage]|uniref:Uncharacterized protein n=1 Tax=uncultured Caudovirales phage TaxID=2100421 RepID=A0A6J5PSN6_9CAUD|nr:hypothetical protein UFOVP929_41 [uncultured Caudovirales phage]